MVAHLDIFTLVVAVVVLVFCLIASVAVYYYYANPQAQTPLFSKIVLCVSFFLILAEPALSVMDVLDANRCKREIMPVNPSYDFTGCTLPLHVMWLTLFVMNMIMVFLVFPFSLFYSQLFSNSAFWKRILQALGLAVVVAGLVISMYAILHFLGPSAIFDVRLLISADVPLGSDTSETAFVAEQCSAVNTTLYGGQVVRACSWQSPEVLSNTDQFEAFIDGVDSPLHFILFVNILIGGIFFSVWAGIGLVSHPWRMFMAFVHRPKVAISKSEFVRRARLLMERAKKLRSRAAHLRDRKKVQGRTFFALGDFLKLLKINREIAALECEEEKMLECFPQGDDPEATWTLHIIRLWIQLFFALFSAALSCLYLVNLFYVALYDSPLPFLSFFLNFVRTEALSHSYTVSVGRTVALLIFNQHILFCTMSGQRVLQDVTPLLSIHCMRHQKTLSASMRSNLLGLIICLQAMMAFFAETLQEAYDSTVLSFLVTPSYGQARTYQRLVMVHPTLWLMISCTMVSAVAFPVSLLLKHQRTRLCLSKPLVEMGP